MTQSIQDLGDRFVFGNDDGTWAVWKGITPDGNGNAVGPGYIGKATFRNNGKVACVGFVPAGLTVNDPLMQGLGIAGWHHLRDIPGEPNIWNKGWDISGHKFTGWSDPFGVSGCEVVFAPYIDASGSIRAAFRVNFVDRYSAMESKRIASVRYDYLVGASDVKVWTTFTEFPDGLDAGPAPYMKEPKYAVGVGGATYLPTVLIVFDAANGTVVSYDLPNDPKLQDPTKGTEQIAWGPRTRLAFYDGVNYLNVVARGNTPLAYGPDGKPTAYGTRDYWAGTGLGLDAFAVDANGRAHYDDSVCAAYCLQGAADGNGNPTLSRKWELAKRGGDPHVEVMLHGWEGGAGLPDCLCAARASRAGRAWTNYFSVSRDSGWTL